MIKRAGFLYAELGLVTGKVDIVAETTARLGSPVHLLPFVKGRGWGLKYLVLPVGASGPTHLVKAASRVIERRVARDPASSYQPYYARFAREAEILGALAAVGLGPEILLLETGFFVREYVPGRCISELGSAELTLWLPRALEALEKICEAGIFHTDPSAENLVCNPERGRLAFIDSEVMVAGPALGALTAERRLFCHERLLATLARSRSAGPETGRSLGWELLEAVRQFYSRRGSPCLSPEHAVALLEGRTVQTRGPS
ncbi:MAG: hypothetical protein JXQ83_08750 [Candidatus Glassbacteria bacterium]|nr:hypothetical protein [Candidatus Glassbacteria bacterium]